MDTSDTALVRSLLATILSRLESDDETPSVDEIKVAARGKKIVIVVLEEAAGPAAGGLDHPGLEKFAVSSDCSSDSAPRTCFIEPDRVCVNSGACEMRGY